MRLTTTITLGLLLFPAARASARDADGYRTGWGHEVRVVSHVAVGLEAGMPRDSWYAKALDLDRRGQYQAAYDAFSRAYREFQEMLKRRPEDRRRIEGWILKTRQQQSVSYTLKSQSYYRYGAYYNSYYRWHRLATGAHLKWLAIRAFGLSPPAKLLQEAFDGYKKVLKLQPNHALSRLQLAALYHEVGQSAEGVAEFGRVQAQVNAGYSSNWMPLAYYYTVSGERDKAFELLRKIAQSSWRRREALQSNQFDRLRGDPRFKAVLGEP